MHKDKMNKIIEELFNTANLAYTLKVALSNTEQPTEDILPYSTIANIIEYKIYSIADLMTDTVADVKEK